MRFLLIPKSQKLIKKEKNLKQSEYLHQQQHLATMTINTFMRNKRSAITSRNITTCKSGYFLPWSGLNTFYRSCDSTLDLILI